MLIDQFQTFFVQKMKERNSHKRLNDLEEHLSDQYDIEFPENSSPEQLLFSILQFIRDNPVEEDDVLSDSIIILNDRYSNGQPYLFSNIETTLSAEELASNIDEVFDEMKVFDVFDFDQIEIATYDKVEHLVEAKFRYTEWYINPVTQERERELNSGVISLHFYINEKICMSSKSGYNKLYSKLLQFICDNIDNIQMKHMYVQLRTKTMKNNRLADFAPITLLTIHLIFKKFKALGFSVNSVSSINFNNEKAPHVKNAKLGGNNLFEDNEVVGRIFNGDKITRFTVTLFKINPDDKAVIVNLTVDFKSILKFTFEDSDFSDRVIQNVCIELYKGIINLIEDEHTIQEGSELIKENLRKASSLSEPAFNQLLKQIRDDIIAFSSTSNEDMELEKKVVEYFSDKYNLD
ncbi:hypothetical protein MRBLBA21_003780 [Peribacillus frigoritolerans]|uniref:hypothetical protein n=1 Tax=Peribacillus frigoritolerans TaxID=450367 RepID=UPI00343F99BB